ncbi:hypothetical protein JNW91_24110 [Micromonospora sp. STR1_7]|uniref:Uncharacterized protein n=1 Tax=Micromonospora parastrephiae TaxID=2806101 RepID=A0ABS1XZE2_9ACTN|nr:hypothetical protein [Micromonospora parastrephiae]MBM0234637.1 hypothetical protein [Micromonospora parastrephiae]
MSRQTTTRPRAETRPAGRNPFERRARVVELQFAIEQMAMRWADAEHRSGGWTHLDPQVARKHRQAARRRQRAFYRLLKALAAEVSR